MARPAADPALLEARGSYRKNPQRHPDAEGEKAREEKLRLRDYTGIAKRYAEDVVAGRIPNCKWVKLACQRHLDQLARESDPTYPYRFDEMKARMFCGRMEQFPHIKGKWARRRELLFLQPWQCFITVVPFGWVRKLPGPLPGTYLNGIEAAVARALNPELRELRQFRKIYLRIPRKNAKSTWAAAVGNVMLVADDEHGAEVYSGATSEKQANEVFNPAKLMLSRSPKLLDKYGVEIWAKAIVRPEDNSKFWPIIGKPGDGASPSCSIHDEYHEHDSSDQVDSMQTGMGSREQPMLIIITTAGTNLASPCHEEDEMAKKVLEGVLKDDELFTVLYGIDEATKDEKGDDWSDPAVLVKANPNIGVSVDRGFLEQQQRNAVLNPAVQNRFRTKHLDEWCGASVAGINMHSWKKAADPTLKLEAFRGEEAMFILDLASKIDICAFMQLFRRRITEQWHYYIFGKFYLPEATIAETKVNQQAYRKWVAQGFLTATEGAEIDFDRVGTDVEELAKQFQVLEIPYDPWRATQLAHQLQKKGAVVVEVGQTAKNMGEAFDELGAALKGGRFHHDGNPVLEWMASNTKAVPVTKGLTVPGKDKNKQEQKIDGIVATVMGMGRWLARDPGGGLDDYLSDPVVVQG